MLSDGGPLGIRGSGGSSTILMEGTGPALHMVGNHHGTAFPGTITDQTWEKERMPIIRDIEILGKNPNANGIELTNTLMAIVQSVLIREVKYGIHLTSRNRNVLIEGVHIYDCSAIGIYAENVNIHQMNIDNCHISYNDRSGVKIEGSEIRNLQITGNDIEYNFALDGERSADIWIDCTKDGSSVREGAITGNTIQAKESENGSNILFMGAEGNHNKIGLFSITGNHISNQAVNIYLESVRGISISGNTFTRGFKRHLYIADSRNIQVGSNVFDKNDDYYTKDGEALGGLRLSNCTNISISDLIIDGVEQDGALEVENSSGIMVSGCQFIDPLNRGIQLKSCKGISISGCQFSYMDKPSENRVSIDVNAMCKDVSIVGNMFQLGRGSLPVNADLGDRVFYQSNLEVK